MRLAAAIVACVLGACGFDLTLPGTQLDGGSGSDGSDSDTMPIDVAPLGPPVACENVPSTAAGNLVACFELEDGVTDGTLRDSSPALTDATTMGFEPAQRTKPATSEAATVLDTASTYVPDSPRLDRASAYTVTMWVQPQAVPPASKALGLYDHELQYAGAIGKATSGNFAQLRCINTNNTYEYTDTIPINTWSFIACTWDGSNLCAQYWSTTSDHQRFCAQTTIARDGDRGLAIGHLSDNGTPTGHLVGSLDSVQLYDRALSQTELCSMVGQPATCLQ